jgi:hypothetical protein
MTRALDTLIGAVAARDPARARQVEQAALDLQLRHRPPAQVDLDRMGPWARQLLVDAAKDRGAVAGDAATLRILWDRADHTIHTTDPTAPERVSAALRSLGEAANKDRSEAAAARVLAFELRCRHEGTSYLSSVGVKSRHDLLCDDIQQIEVIVEQVLKHDPLDSRLG